MLFAKINYVGLIRIGVEGTAKAAGAIEALYGSFAALAERQKDLLVAADSDFGKKAEMLKKAAVTMGTVVKVVRLLDLSLRRLACMTRLPKPLWNSLLPGKKESERRKNVLFGFRSYANMKQRWNRSWSSI